MTRSNVPHDAPWPRPGLSARGSALVCVNEPRAALATVLILQELGIAVDLVEDASAALRWVERARYDVLVVAGDDAPALAEALRAAAPRARILLLRDEPPPDLDSALRIEVIGPPADVNGVMRALWSLDLHA